MPAPTPGSVAVWTSCDLPGLGDQLLGRVIEAELLARLPGWRSAFFAPLGWERPAPGDGGVVAEPLGTPTPARISRLAAGATLSVLCPAFPLGAELTRLYDDARADAAAPFFTAGLGSESSHPVLLTGVRVTGTVPADLVALAGRAPMITVRDADSRARLRKAGVQGDIAVLPHPGLVPHRAVDMETLPSRAQQLRQLGMLPGDGTYLAVTEPVELPANLAGADTLVVLPPALCLEDRLAMLAAARAVIATDEHVAAAAAGLGVPWVLVDRDGADRAAVEEFADARRIVRSFDEVAAALRATENAPPYKESATAAIAEALDRVAEFAERVSSGDEAQPRATALSAENRALRAANQRQRDRVRLERQRLTDAFASAVLERDSAVEELERIRTEHAELTTRHADLTGRFADCERELSAWQNTKLVRWSKPLRQVYGRARGR